MSIWQQILSVDGEWIVLRGFFYFSSNLQHEIIIIDLIEFPC